MTSTATIETLANLEQEMARAGRERERSALAEARRALNRVTVGLLSPEEAAQRLRVSESTIERWLQYGRLAGGLLAGKWFVSEREVDQLIRIRESLWALDEEGNPEDDELTGLPAEIASPVLAE